MHDFDLLDQACASIGIDLHVTCENIPPRFTLRLEADDAVSPRLVLVIGHDDHVTARPLDVDLSARCLLLEIREQSIQRDHNGRWMPQQTAHLFLVHGAAGGQLHRVPGQPATATVVEAHGRLRRLRGES